MAYAVSLPIMQRGSVGSHVAELQTRLNAMFGEEVPRLPVTGHFDRRTAGAVMTAQLHQNNWARGEGEPMLRNDGRVDSQTWEFILGRTESVVAPRMRSRGLGTVEPLMLDSRNATRTCRDGSVVGLIGGWCPEDRVGTHKSSSGTEALPTDWTRFAIGAAAGAAAIFILWRLK